MLRWLYNDAQDVAAIWLCSWRSSCDVTMLPLHFESTAMSLHTFWAGQNKCREVTTMKILICIYYDLGASTLLLLFLLQFVSLWPNFRIIAESPSSGMCFLVTRWFCYAHGDLGVSLKLFKIAAEVWFLTYSTLPQASTTLSLCCCRAGHDSVALPLGLCSAWVFYKGASTMIPLRQLRSLTWPERQERCRSTNIGYV